MNIDHLIDRSEPGAWARALRHREEARVELPEQHKPEREIAGLRERDRGGALFHKDADT